MAATTAEDDDGDMDETAMVELHDDEVEVPRKEMLIPTSRFKTH